MLSRAQWYVLTTVRLVCLLVLIVSLGRKVERMALPAWANMIIGAVVVVAGTMLYNTWAISYSTYLNDQEKPD